MWEYHNIFFVFKSAVQRGPQSGDGRQAPAFKLPIMPKPHRTQGSAPVVRVRVRVAATRKEAVNSISITSPISGASMLNFNRGDTSRFDAASVVETAYIHVL